jgi:hypothetical protein
MLHCSAQYRSRPPLPATSLAPDGASDRPPVGQVSGQDLAPGNYVALDATSRTPPLTTFTIAKASSPAKLPKPQATVSSIEFGFRGPGTLHNGKLARFANDGFVVHMIVAARGANQAGANKIAKLRERMRRPWRVRPAPLPRDCGSRRQVHGRATGNR